MMIQSSNSLILVLVMKLEINKNKKIWAGYALVILASIIAIIILSNRATKNSEVFTGDPKSIDATIFSLEKNVGSNPKDVQASVSLSQAYLQKIRETADISYYQKIEELMDNAEKVEPNNAEIYATRAEVAQGRHNFKEAHVLINKAIEVNPSRARYFGIRGDAEIELGQYKEATGSFQAMVNLRPDFSSYVRIAYIRELYGDVKGAKESLRQAISAGSNFKENIAFAYTELGKLEMRSNLSKGKENFDLALKVTPKYNPALVGLGTVAYFENDLQKSKEYFLQAYNSLPIEAYATLIADLEFVEGNTTQASQYLTLAEIAFSSSSSRGINTDLEESLFLSDHNIRLPEALAKAEKAYKERPSIYAADYLSWALYKNDQLEKASSYSKEALRLGEHDPLILFHQGMISYKKGDRASAEKYLKKALVINPYFSVLHAGVAKKTLEDLN
ncbi:MAG: hypothetical protein M3Q34_03285 [bacterium]|nr:hypothetical protein [bacterium]